MVFLEGKNPQKVVFFDVIVKHKRRSAVNNFCFLDDFGRS